MDGAALGEDGAAFAGVAAGSESDSSAAVLVVAAPGVAAPGLAVEGGGDVRGGALGLIRRSTRARVARGDADARRRRRRRGRGGGETIA